MAKKKAVKTKASAAPKRVKKKAPPKKTAPKKSTKKKAAKKKTSTKPATKKKTAAPKKTAAVKKEPVAKQDTAPKAVVKKRRPRKKKTYTRKKAVWNIYSPTMKIVAQFDFHEEAEATKKLAQLNKRGKTNHYMVRGKTEQEVPIEEMPVK